MARGMNLGVGAMTQGTRTGVGLSRGQVAERGGGGYLEGPGGHDPSGAGAARSERVEERRAGPPRAGGLRAGGARSCAGDDEEEERGGDGDGGAAHRRNGSSLEFLLPRGIFSVGGVGG